jgi:hypothetical protein
MTVGGSYACRVFHGGKEHVVLVWNGVKNYARKPSPDNLACADLGGLEFGERIFIAQIRAPCGTRGRASTAKTLSVLLSTCDSVILWTRDTKTYNAIRDDLRNYATLNFDGTPKALH